MTPFPQVAFTSNDPDHDAPWAEVPQIFRRPERVLTPPWNDLFEPLRQGLVDELMVIGQLGQSLDGRIATTTGHSKFINGPTGLAHLHRLRAVVDAVVVGIGTALADDPQLTVRMVEGPHPARIILDPRGRLPATARVLANDGVRRLVITAEGTPTRFPEDVEVLALPADDGRIAPRAILSALASQGFRRILIEGGADTVSRFLGAGCLDRLHVMVAPIILGAGYPGLSLAPIKSVDDALRPTVRAYPFGDEVLFDCNLSKLRVPVGRPKKSV